MLQRTARPIAIGAGTGRTDGSADRLRRRRRHRPQLSRRLLHRVRQLPRPERHEQIDVEVRLTNDVITSLTVTPHAYDRNAARFQGQFVDGIGDAVVGADIDLLAIARVAGSSLTSGGFNTALAEIKDQAVE